MAHFPLVQFLCRMRSFTSLNASLSGTSFSLDTLFIFSIISCIVSESNLIISTHHCTPRIVSTRSFNTSFAFTNCFCFRLLLLNCLTTGHCVNCFFNCSVCIDCRWSSRYGVYFVPSPFPYDFVFCLRRDRQDFFLCPWYDCRDFFVFLREVDDNLSFAFFAFFFLFTFFVFDFFLLSNALLPRDVRLGIIYIDYALFPIPMLYLMTWHI
eukprot:487959_1